MKPKKQPEKWEDKLTKHWIENPLTWEERKWYGKFIFQTRRQAISETLEKVKLEKRDINNYKFIGSESSQIEVQRDMGYNQAVDDLTNLKNKLKEEE